MVSFSINTPTLGPVVAAKICGIFTQLQYVHDLWLRKGLHSGSNVDRDFSVWMYEFAEVVATQVQQMESGMLTDEKDRWFHLWVDSMSHDDSEAGQCIRRWILELLRRVSKGLSSRLGSGEQS